MITTYKIGNNVKAILRFYTASKIGAIQAEYDNQPYTVLNNIEAQISFTNITSDAQTTLRELSYNTDSVTSVTLNNVELTNKILNLICSNSEQKLCSTMQNYNADDEGNIYLLLPSDEIYQVFVYNNDGELEQAYGSYSDNVLHVEKPSTNYAIFYSFLGSDGYSFNRRANIYLSIDLELTSNENNQSKKAWMHFNKCALTANKNMLFGGNINSVDLTFKVLKEDYQDSDYIAFK